MAVKFLFLPQNYKNHPAAGGYAPGPPLWYVWVAFVCSAQGLTYTTFVQEKFTFGICTLPRSKILVALLVTFTAADKFFKWLHGPHTKRANKRCWAYSSIFSNKTSKFWKWRIICSHKISSRKISVFMCKSSVYFSAPPPHFWLVPPHFVCSGDGTGRRQPEYFSKSEMKTKKCEWDEELKMKCEMKTKK